MKLSAARSYKKRHKYLGGLILHNPLLALGLDLPFVIATATSLKNAVAISFELFFVHIITMTVALVTCRKLSALPRVLVNALVSTLAMLVARNIILQVYPQLINAVGMYVYLMAVNGMTLLHANYLERDAKPWPVLTSATRNAAGFLVAMVLVGLVREYIGNATLWGISVPLPFKISGMLVPFSGFILTGMLLAGLKFLGKKIKGYSIMEIMREEAQYIDVSTDKKPTE